MTTAEHITVRVVAGVVIEKDDKYLLVQEGEGLSKGKWNFPAGRVESGRTIEETARQEALEEAGIVVDLGDKVGVWHTGLDHPVCHLFEATIISGEIRPAPGEIEAIEWFSLAQIEGMRDQLRMIWVLEGVQRVALKKAPIGD